MSRVIGFHVIGCTYGFWMPNAQSGSGSDYVRAEHLRKFGPAAPWFRLRRRRNERIADHGKTERHPPCGVESAVGNEPIAG